MIAPINKIKSLLSEDVVSLLGDDVINNAYLNAYKVVVNLISDDNVLESLFKSGISDGLFSTVYVGSIDGLCQFNQEGYADKRRILSVQRKNSMGLDHDDEFYECYKISTLKGETCAVNKNSMYYENDRWDPKFFITKDSKISILPLDIHDASGGTRIPKATIYWISSPSFDPTEERLTFNLAEKNISSLTAEEEHELFLGIPSGAQELVYIELVLTLAQSYMADFVYSEEDQELAKLVSDQVAFLSMKKKDEVDFVVATYGNPGVIKQ